MIGYHIRKPKTYAQRREELVQKIIREISYRPAPEAARLNEIWQLIQNNRKKYHKHFA